jgi:hypothetical protein
VVGAATCERPPLPGRPDHDLVIDAAYAIGPVRVRYGVDALVGMTADLTGQIAVPTRVLHSVGARVDLDRMLGLGPDGTLLRLAVDVRNLGDLRFVSYQGATGPVREPIGDAYEYPLPGRSVLVSLRYVHPNAAAPPQDASRAAPL